MQPTQLRRTAVFAGPSLAGSSSFLEKLGTDRFTFFPPVQRGDIAKLSREYSEVVIADGFFQSVPAVGHVEIREALQWQKVFGCSSMGAIRAYEMRNMGVIGFGKVYQFFYQHEDFTDGELAQEIGPAPDYKALTEPLVHYRFCIQEILKRNLISANDATELMTELTSQFYGDLTIPFFLELLSKYTEKQIVNNIASNFSMYRIKNHDLFNLLQKLDRNEL